MKPAAILIDRANTPRLYSFDNPAGIDEWEFSPGEIFNADTISESEYEGRKREAVRVFDEVGR